ncbi:MAG: HAD family phosphatase [Gammaproteobacteria bacterium]|uniref:HAD family hydrolase n=1 Tax=Rhodoferax sp. TaxID=50421 RepID=UPI001808C78A|nr:HAD family phosphatase [Rhodoferax sp.]MBU3897830.1 HAD family phosphatase [Gammaproteobacteria bacterium]MBA3059223.1 HAD family phosphatase [Rhodoferax sp.]MBU3997294.1 HAD family phosphatase [Gammaproteobacteria bacterium]MBU4017905.1 HAD family phosphatase [Gammaproteobacteria bacterium]MBU4078640.1 HAD family phosphatase [Gammaproteobacteria bacterium]
MTIVFDFGAVLFTWRPADLLRRHFPVRAASAPQAAELAQAVFSHADWHQFDRGVLAMDAVVTRTAARLGLAPAALTRMMESIPDHLAPMQDTLALLTQLRALLEQQAQASKLYFLSNMPAPYARALVQRHDFLQCFDGGVFSSEVALIKPEAEIYALIERRYALAPASTIFIDDNAANVHAAQARGWRGIRFESASQLQAELAQHDLVLWP